MVIVTVMVIIVRTSVSQFRPNQKSQQLHLTAAKLCRPSEQKSECLSKLIEVSSLHTKQTRDGDGDGDGGGGGNGYDGDGYGDSDRDGNGAFDGDSDGDGDDGYGDSDGDGDSF